MDNVKEETSPSPSAPKDASKSSANATIISQSNNPSFLVSGGPSSSDSQESSIQAPSLENSNASSSLDGVKVENGILCNARLQEAWETENKASPETPWRYMPTSNIDQSKVFTRESSVTDNSSVLQIINKGQAIEMSSSGVYQTKRYNFNSTINNKVAQNKIINQERLNERNKQLLLERELKLQKSLSEECADLGVDEPSPSDLFPEADLPFDHSPAFDQLSQEASSSQSIR